jgi:RNA polymerase sigma-70 factor, ECF subfamily
MDEAAETRRAAVEAVWDRYAARLLAFIRGRVSDPHDAEDLLQEAFLRIHRGLCCLREWTSLEPWVYQIARNLVIDHYRARHPAAEAPEDLEAPAPDPADEPARELAASLREIVQQLPEPYRQALILTELEGMSQKRLAETAGISLSGAKSRVQRARGKLRDMLLACCHFELDRRGRIIDYHARCCCCAATAVK